MATDAQLARRLVPKHKKPSHISLVLAVLRHCYASHIKSDQLASFQSHQQMSQQLSDDAIAVLQHLDYDGLSIRFSQVSPTLYSEVNEVLTRLGGKWKGGRTKAHVFQEDPTHLIEYVLTTALMPPKNPDAFFPTPNEVARGIMMMSDLDKLCDDDLFLEPQAGSGALPDYLQQHASEFLQSDDFAPLKPRIHLVEKSPVRCAILRAKGYTNIHQGDFLLYQTDLRFARILMNPPFSVPGAKTAYIDHILHAFTFLAPGGVLTTIAPDHFIRHDDQRSQSFLEFVTTNGYFELNDANAFTETGTSVQTLTIALEKPTERETHIVENEPYQNYLNYFCFLIWLRIDNEPHLYDRATHLGRMLNEGHFNRNLLGEPDAKARHAIQQLFETAIDELRHLGAHIKMQDAWMNWLISTFIKEHTTEHAPPYSLQAA